MPPVVTTDLVFVTESGIVVFHDSGAVVEYKNIADGAFWDPKDKAETVSLSNGNDTATLVQTIRVTNDLILPAAILEGVRSSLIIPAEALGNVVAGCPPPNVDGSTIFPNTCTLTDLNGVTYAWDSVGPSNGPFNVGNWEFTQGGVPFSMTAQLQRNDGGNIWRGDNIGKFRLWSSITLNNGPFQTLSPAKGPVGTIFRNLTKIVGYQSIQMMLAAAALGDVLQIPMVIGGPGALGSLDILGSGLGMWADGGAINVASVTLQAAAEQGRFGALIGNINFEGKASIIAQNTANGTVLKNLHIAYGATGDPTSGIFQDRNVAGLTVQNCLVRGYDHGIITSGGTGGTTSIHDTELHDNGDTTGSQTHGSTHNFYLGSDDACDIQGVVSYNVLSGGHTGKTRTKVGFVGTTKGCVFAQLNGDSSVCLDIPCGGSYSIKNSIFERGPGALGESQQFINFGTEITIVGNCDMTNRTQAITIDGCTFIDDGPEGFPGSPTIICNNAFAQTGVQVIVKNCKIISNGGVAGGGTGASAPPAVTLGSNVSDGGGNTFFASRTAAGLPAYDGTLDCIPPTPDDPIVQVLAGMVVGQWKKLTAAGQGNVANAEPPNVSGAYRSYFDSLFISSGGTTSTFASDLACETAVHPNGLAQWAFSRPGVRAGVKPWTVFSGGGHTDSADSSIVAFDISAACAQLILNGTLSNWILEYAGATLLPQGSANPSWSPFNHGSSANYFVPDANIYGQHRVAASHTYQGVLWHPLGGGDLGFGAWSHSGFFAGNDANAAIGGAEVFDDTGSNIKILSNATTGAGFYGNSNQSQMALCDLDGAIYVWIDSPSQLAKYANPTTSPTQTSVVGLLNPPSGIFIEVPGLVIRDPINGASKRAFFTMNNAENAFDLITDITGTPHEFSGAQGTFAAIPARAAVHESLCRNDVLGQIVMWDGTGNFFPITPNTSNPPRGWTWVKGSNTPSGDIPQGATQGDWPQHVYDRMRNCYYGAFMGDVYLYKPGANGAV